MKRQCLPISESLFFPGFWFAEFRKKSYGLNSWADSSRYSSSYPKSWCKPFDIEKEPQYLLAGMKYALSLRVDILIPPGNIDHFHFAVEHIDEALAHPLSEEDVSLLKERLPEVTDRPFYD